MSSFGPGTSAAGGGTGHVNMDRYLGINQAGGQQMAQGVTNNIGATASASREALTGLLNSGLQQAELGKQGEGGEYTGPKTLGDVDPEKYKKIVGQVSDVTARAGAAGGQGLGTLLREQYGQGRAYSGGENAMDAFLAGATGGNQLRGLATTASQLRGGLAGAEERFASSARPAPTAPPPWVPPEPAPTPPPVTDTGQPGQLWSGYGDPGVVNPEASGIAWENIGGNPRRKGKGR